MSRAIHEAISSWRFQDLSIVKKNCGHFGMIGITRLFAVFARVLIPGDGKQIRVQFYSEAFLLRPVLTLKLFHYLNFCLEFHAPFLLCIDDLKFNLKMFCCDHFFFLFSSYYI